jgi:thiamine-monophosphate kinase
LTLAVTVVGHADRAEELVPRSGARDGDVLLVTGELGAAAAGRLLLDDPRLGEAISETTADSLRARQLDPLPRLRSGRALAGAGAIAMLDLRGGLAGDARHLAEAGSVRLRIDAASLPLAYGVAEVAAAAGRDPLELATGGGEDYELLAALPPEQLQAAIEAVASAGETTLTQVGRILAGEGVEIRLPGGGLLDPGGFDHFREP